MLRILTNAYLRLKSVASVNTKISLGFAAVITVANFWLKLAIPGFNLEMPFVFMFPSAILSTLLGGFRAGLFSIVLTIFLADYFLLSPESLFSFGQNGYKQLFVFVSQGIFLVWIINKLKELNETNERLNALKDEFIAVASHELKTPLTSIKGYNQILANQLKKEARKNALKLTDRMASQIDNLTNLINELLDVSKIQSGKLDLNLETFSLDQLLLDVTQNMQQIYASHKLRVKKKDRKNNLVIKADQARISQVLENLISNAIKYSPNSNKVDISIFQHKSDSNNDQKKKYVAVSVRDYGIGMAKDDLNIIFDRFAQLENNIKQGSTGLGLGLYISSEITKRHNGYISVKSQKNKGSTFTINLPVGYR